MTENTRKLLKELENLRGDMDVLLEDETVLSLPKAYERLKDRFDYILNDLEEGKYDEEGEKE
jgi:hypothetical protein